LALLTLIYKFTPLYGHYLTSKKNHENDPQKGNIDIDELMAKIDKRIAELEEEERREQEALKKKASEQKQEETKKPEVKRTPNKKDDRSTCSIVIKSISSFEMTSAVICTYLGLPSQEGDSLLRKTLARKDRKLTGIPCDKASMMMTMFRNIGTIATKVDEVA
jgi:cytochrome P450